VSCQVIRPPAKEACGEPASRLVTFCDDQKVSACVECALYLEQVAASHGTQIRVESKP
jgi:hypothetical protein